MRFSRLLLCSALGSIAGAVPAAATHHHMLIEQVIVGVNGDPSAQAVQLRMTRSMENLVQDARLRVLDAAGMNPVMLIDFTTPVQPGTGRRILVATPTFATVPAVTPDFLMNPIPSSRFAAGSLVFETDATGVVQWRLSWGGPAYTGSGIGSFNNDLDGQFNPPYPLALPSSGDGLALIWMGLWNPPYPVISSNNLQDYQLTPVGTPATFMNNAGDSGQVSVPLPADESTWGRIKSSYR